MTIERNGARRFTLIEKLKQTQALIEEIVLENQGEITDDDIAQMKYWLIILPGIIRRAKEKKKAGERHE